MPVTRTRETRQAAAARTAMTDVEADMDTSMQSSHSQRRRRDHRTQSSTTASSSTFTRPSHATPLSFSSHAALVAHTHELVQWRDGDEEEEKDNGLPPLAQTQSQATSMHELDTSSLMALWSHMPSTLVAACFDLELNDDDAKMSADTTSTFLTTSSEGDVLIELIRTVRAWNEWSILNHRAARPRTAAEVEARPTSSSMSTPQTDLWFILHQHGISVRNIVTFCYLLLTRPPSILSFHAAALYLSLVELSARTHASQSSIHHATIMRSIQRHVQIWARHETSSREAGRRKKKAAGAAGAAANKKMMMMNNADPFAEESMMADDPSNDQAWLSTCDAAGYILDYLDQCQRLFGSNSHENGDDNNRMDLGTPLPLFPFEKQSELLPHCIETLVDLTRTDINTSSSSSTTSAKNENDVHTLIVRRSFDTLLLLLHPAHGNVVYTSQLLFKHMLASVLVSFSHGGAATAPTMPRHLMSIHRTAIAFIKRIVHYITSNQQACDMKALHAAVLHLMQHLLIRSAERSDYRKLIAQALVNELLTPDEQEEEENEAQGPSSSSHVQLWISLRAPVVRFLHRLSRQKKPNLRLIALEVSECIMNHTWAVETGMDEVVLSGTAVSSSSSSSTSSKDTEDGSSHSPKMSFAEKLKEAAAEEEEEDDEQKKQNETGTTINAAEPLLMSDDATATTATANGIGSGGIPLARILLSLLISRCSDASPVVRARALGALAHVLERCAQLYAPTEDDDDDVEKEEEQQSEATKRQNVLRARFAMVMAEKLTIPYADLTCAPASSSTSAPMTAQRRSRSAPLSIAATPGRSFMHSPLHSTMATNTTTGGAGLDSTINLPPLTPAAGVGGMSGTSMFGLVGGIGASSCFHPSNPGIRDILIILYRRSADEKALVRRAAILALQAIVLAAAREEKWDAAQRRKRMAVFKQQQEIDGSAPMDVSTTPSASNDATFSHFVHPAAASPAPLLSCLTASDLQIFYDGCFDKSLSLRKQSMMSLTALFKHYIEQHDEAFDSNNQDASAASSLDDSLLVSSLSNLSRIWLGAVLPLIVDRERGVVDKCVEVIEEVIVKRVERSIKRTQKAMAMADNKKKKQDDPLSSSTTAIQQLASLHAADRSPASAWSLFGAMDGEMLHYFQVAFVAMLKSSRLQSDLIKCLVKDVEMQCSRNEGGENDATSASFSADRLRALWSMLEVLCRHSHLLPSGTKVDLLRVALHRGWTFLRKEGGRMDECSVGRLLTCMAFLAEGGVWSVEECVEMAAQLCEDLLHQIQMDPKIIKKHSLTEGASDMFAASSATSPEIIKKQLFLLNALCATMQKQQAEGAGAGHGSKKKLASTPVWEDTVLNACEKQLHTFIQVASTSKVTMVGDRSSSSSASSSVHSSQVWNESILTSILFTLGEVVLQHRSYSAKSAVSSGLLQLLQTFLAPDIHVARVGSKWKHRGHGAGVGAGAGMDMRMDESDAAQQQQAGEEGTTSSTAATATSASVVSLSSSIRAHAFLTLGKLCLRNEVLAKRCIQLFIAELEQGASTSVAANNNNAAGQRKQPMTPATPSASPSASSGSVIIQNNILVLLCDLCRTFTNLVDPYLPTLTSLLQHPNALLRKHTVMVLNVLLAEEYVKMHSTTHVKQEFGVGHSNASNGADAGGEDDSKALLQGAHHGGSSSMIYRYLRCLVDDDPSIRQLIQASLSSILSSKGSSGSTSSQPTGASVNMGATRLHMHFVELVYFLNACHQHPLYNQFGAAAAAAAAATSNNNKRGSGSSSTATTISASSDDSAFTLVGPLGSLNASKRFALYRYLLSQMSDEQKFILMSKFHTDVLSCINEDTFRTKPWHRRAAQDGIQDVVQDTLIILASEAMQLGGGGRGGGATSNKGDASSSGSSVEAVENELQEMALAEEVASSDMHGGSSSKSASAIATLHAQTQAKQKLLHKLLKKSTMDSCLPILFELRTTLAKVHSPLSQWVLHLFNVLLDGYRNELDESFAANRMLERELKFDLRRWMNSSSSMDADQKAMRERWRKLDFPPTTEVPTHKREWSTAKKPMQRTPATSQRTPSATGVAASPSMSRVGGMDSATRRLSLSNVAVAVASVAGGHQNGQAVSATPLKNSSLSSLRVAGAGQTPLNGAGHGMVSPAPFQLFSPKLRRTSSTPLSTSSASASKSKSMSMLTPALRRTQGSSFATPGLSPINHRSHSKRLRRSMGGSSVPGPVAVDEGEEDEIDDEEEEEKERAQPQLSSSDSDTDVEDEDEHAPSTSFSRRARAAAQDDLDAVAALEEERSNLALAMAPTSSLSSLPKPQTPSSTSAAAAASAWKVVLRDEEGQRIDFDDEDEEDGENAGIGLMNTSASASTATTTNKRTRSGVKSQQQPKPKRAESVPSSMLERLSVKGASSSSSTSTTTVTPSVAAAKKRKHISPIAPQQQQASMTEQRSASSTSTAHTSRPKRKAAGLR